MTQVGQLKIDGKDEVTILDGCMKRFNTEKEKMFVEDLCAMDKLTEEKISDLLKLRLQRGDAYTFAGDVLISINSNEMPNELPRSVSLYFENNIFAFTSLTIFCII